MDDEQDRLRPGLVAPVRIAPRAEGGPTRAQVRSSAWRRTSRGFYVPTAVRRSVEQRIVEASVVVPAGFGITGWAALRWLGARWFEGTERGAGDLPVTIAIGTHDVRPQEGIAVSGEGLNPARVRIVDGVPVTEAAYATSFEMRYARSDWQAAVVLDMAAYDDLVSIEELSAFVSPGQNGWTGVPQARRAVLLADENAWSPAETIMRLVWTSDPRFARPLANRPLFDLRGNHLVTPDLIDPDAGVVAEYDGALHLVGEQRDRDVRRDATYRDLGLEAVVMTAVDLRDSTAFLQRLAAAHRRAAAVRAQGGGAARGWTIEPPEWWMPTWSVARRRALTPSQAALFLRYRGPAA